MVKGPAVNDLIFRELIKRGYALEGNTRIWNIADSKLWYLTPKQSQAFLDLESSEDYQKDVIQKEIDLINGNVGNIMEEFKNDSLNIVDLGCGDGKKAVIFIEHLKGKLDMRYCPIDISGYMVERAISKIKKLDAGEVVKFQWNISDFENLDNIFPLLRDKDYKKNLLLLLGNTLGNFEINELLYQVKGCMKEGDFVLIGNVLDNRNEEDVLKSYHNQELNNLLVHLPISLGLKKADVEFGVRFANSRVEMYYTILRDKEIKFQDKRVVFHKGDQLLSAVSYKYQKENFEEFLKMYFKDVKMYTSDDGTYALALCKK